MPIALQCDTFPLSHGEVECLWHEVIKRRGHPNDVVALRCVAEAESARLNEQYRGKTGPTNVLTFSYPGEEGAEHDIALCLPVVEREALAHEQTVEDYLAWVVTHALLHATGMDHEASAAADQAMRQLEQEILRTVATT